MRHCEIVYDSAVDPMTSAIEGAEVRPYSNVPFKLGPSTFAMGLMTKNDIDASRGYAMSRTGPQSEN